jgi:glycosyltransferase involved in cell wall biosynthesis
MASRNLARGLADLGFSVTVVAPGAKVLRSYWEEDGPVRVWRVRSVPVQNRLEFYLAILPRRQIRRQFLLLRPDLVQVNTPGPIGRGVMREGARLEAVTVAGLHIIPESFYALNSRQWLSRALSWVSWRLLVRFHNRASFVVAPTNTALNLFRSHGLTAPGSSISNGVKTVADDLAMRDPRMVRRGLGIPDLPTIAYLGRLSRSKNLDMLIEVLALLLQRVDTQLVLIGDGNARQRLVHLVRHYSVEDRVIFTGWIVDDETKRRYLTAADVFITPSEVELGSIAIMEAMVAARPVVAANAGALPELVSNGVNGSLFSPGDSQECADKVYDLLSSESKRKAYGEESRRIVQERALKKTSSLHAQLYRSLLAHARQ